MHPSSLQTLDAVAPLIEGSTIGAWGQTSLESSVEAHVLFDAIDRVLATKLGDQGAMLAALRLPPTPQQLFNDLERQVL